MFPKCPLQQELLKRDEGEPGHIYFVCEERLWRERLLSHHTDILLGHMRLSHNVQTHPGCLAAYSDSRVKPQIHSGYFWPRGCSDTSFAPAWISLPCTLSLPLAPWLPWKDGGPTMFLLAFQFSTCAHRSSETQALILFRNNECSERSKKTRKRRGKDIDLLKKSVTQSLSWDNRTAGHVLTQGAAIHGPPWDV